MRIFFAQCRVASLSSATQEVRAGHPADRLSRWRLDSSPWDCWRPMAPRKPPPTGTGSGVARIARVRANTAPPDTPTVTHHDPLQRNRHRRRGGLCAGDLEMQRDSAVQGRSPARVHGCSNPQGECLGSTADRILPWTRARRGRSMCRWRPGHSPSCDPRGRPPST